MSQPKWLIYICFHRKLILENYEHDELFNPNNFIGLKVSGSSYCRDLPTFENRLGMQIVEERNLGNFYDPGLQKKLYMASSGLYHIYKNNIHRQCEYIGYMEYDFKLQLENKSIAIAEKSASNFIEKLVAKKTPFILGLSARWSLKDLFNQNYFQVRNQNCMLMAVKDYNEFYGTSHCIDSLLTKNPIIITQQTFVCDSKTFERIAKFLEFFIKKYDPKELRGFPAGIAERYIGVALYLDKTPKMYYPLVHTAKHGY